MNTYIFIHGGESFFSHEEYMSWISTTGVEWNIEPYIIREEKKKWKIELAKKLVEKGNLVYLPGFPNPQNAKYEEWKIFFESWIDRISIQGNIIFIGTSLGGNFLLKYFSECSVIAKNEAIQGSGITEHGLLRTSQGQTYQIDQIHLLAACQKCGNFTPPNNYEYLQQLGSRVHIWHADDDSVVPFSVGQEIAKNLPKAETHFFPAEKGYGHFHGVERIPELESEIFQK